MEKWIDKIFSLKKFPGQLVFVVWISSLSLAILPKTWLDKFMLTGFKNEFEKFIGPVILFSTAITLWMVSKYIIDKVRVNKYISKRQQQILEYLNHLNFNEIIVLREFILHSKTTILAPFNDETVISLENKGLIYKATQSAVVNGIDMGYPYSITEFTHENLSNHQLGLPADLHNISEELRRKIISERPNWAKEIEQRQEMYRKYVSMR